MGGLKTEISEGIQMFKPQSLNDVINLARMKDEQLARPRRFIRPPPPKTPLALPPPNCVTPANLSTAFRRLSWEKMQRRRVQCLCFNYNERFMAGHKCQQPQLLLLEGYTYTGNMSYEDITYPQTRRFVQGEETREVRELELEPEITLHALTCWTTPRTMRVTTKLVSHTVMVLIDSRSTHNFISDRLANTLHLLIKLTKLFIV
jgi:hypothetical protein